MSALRVILSAEREREKLAALRLEPDEKDIGAMAWVLKMDDATIESGLVHDFDASLSGIGQELGAGAYSMRLEEEGLELFSWSHLAFMTKKS